MDKKEVKELLIGTIVKICGSTDSLQADFSGKSLIDDFDMDSISLMELLVELEEQFGISFDSEDNLLELLDSFDDLLEYIYKGGGLNE